MAKSKQDYFNAGKSDAQHGRVTGVPRGASWQSKAYYEGYDSVGMEKPTCEILTSYNVLFNLHPNIKNREFRHFYIVDTDTGNVLSTRIHRKTHARKIAAKLGYRVV